MNRLKVAIVSESFLPAVNGVTNTVRHCADRLLAGGHEVLVVAPAPGLASYRGAKVVRVRSFGLPGYRTFSVGLPDGAVGKALADFEPDVVHLASPFALGYVGLRAARRLGIPTVAVYQTDVAGFARQYGVPGDGLLDRWVGHLHRRADRNLVPSTASATRLRRLGVDDVHLWRRGVDLSLFDPAHRNDDLHAAWSRRSSGDPRVVVGYVGRLAAEKEVHRLEEVARVPGVRLVVVGDGPERARLERALPEAKFTGMLSGRDLAGAFASLDVFVHTGPHETFCQTVQEAQASGVPVVAPAAGGPLDLVRHGVTGLLFDPEDPRSLRRAVAVLGGDPDLRARLGAAGHREVQGRTWERVVDELVTRHYPAVLGAHRPAQRAA
ncbi:glycosyltransferase family 4 protein [Nocardioides iriomotensis]|uniref:Glycosyltransferase family 1 protein n=1 Tax=Nocardioides iriomotensis TaxID=715784 RepID=A0A4Q5IYG1_9ACTN|nr:glycosyltransferase family 1 protein [Nocardioides iriomotensis]RYU09975.1 glycosyltransferase family 1 protein [Nocardioides iriomotensis]